jgi:small subunit ribosomal protein S7
MPRRKYKKNIVKPDQIYGSFEVSKLINYIMVDGKKSVAENVVYQAMDLLKEKKLEPLNVLHRVIQNVSPNHEVKAKRVGGASYLVPQETRAERRIFLALNWIVNASRARSSKEFKGMAQKLVAELMDAYNDIGEAVNKKKQVEKLAEANKAFAHFKW